jgi:hypothetical protein
MILRQETSEEQPMPMLVSRQLREVADALCAVRSSRLPLGSVHEFVDDCAAAADPQTCGRGSPSHAPPDFQSPLCRPIQPEREPPQWCFHAACDQL